MGFKEKLRKKLRETVGAEAGQKLAEVTGSDQLGKFGAKLIGGKKAAKKIDHDD